MRIESRESAQSQRQTQRQTFDLRRAETNVESITIVELCALHSLCIFSAEARAQLRIYTSHHTQEKAFIIIVHDERRRRRRQHKPSRAAHLCHLPLFEHFRCTIAQYRAC